MELETPRLRLRHWRETDGDSFADLHADPIVNADLGGPFSREKSDKKLTRYIKAQTEHGFTRWVIEDKGGTFLGYTGIMHVSKEHPLGIHNEIGWRLNRDAWSKGYAREAARAALEDGFTRLGLTEIYAYTSESNLRSQALMERIGMKRDRKRDFTAHYEGYGDWHGLVWVV